LIQAKIPIWEILRCIVQPTLITHRPLTLNKRVGISPLKVTHIPITKGRILQVIITITIVITGSKSPFIKDHHLRRGNHKQHPRSIFNITKRIILMEVMVNLVILTNLFLGVIHIHQAKLDLPMLLINKEEATILNSMATTEISLQA